MDDVMGTAEAARRLEVAPQRVRALWHEGATGRPRLGRRRWSGTAGSGVRRAP